MSTKKIFFTCLFVTVIAAVLVQNSVFAASADYGDGVYKAAGNCKETNTSIDYYTSCYGYSWRYYEYKFGKNDSVTFYKHSGTNTTNGKWSTGSDVTVACGEGTEGFYFLGWEAHKSNGTSSGYHVASTTLSKARNHATNPEGTSVGTSQSNSKSLAGTPITWGQAQKAYNEAKQFATKNNLGYWREWTDASNNTEWFCYHETQTPPPSTQESVEFQGQSKISMDGAEKTAGFTKNSATNSVSRTYAFDGAPSSIDITFTHNMKGNSSKSSNTESSWSVSNTGEASFSGSPSGKFKLDAKQSKGPETVATVNATVSLSQNVNKEICSTLNFDNGSGQGKTTVCALISVGKENYNVSFQGESHVYAAADITVSEEPGGDVSASDNGDGTFNISSGTKLDGAALKILNDDQIKLRYEHQLTRTDSSNVDKVAAVWLAVGPIPGTESMRNAVAQLLNGSKTTLFKEGSLDNAIQELVSKRSNLSSQPLPYVTEFTKGETVTVFDSTYTFNVKAEQRQLCHVLTYKPTRQVDENGNSTILQALWSVVTSSIKAIACVIQNLTAGDSSDSSSIANNCGGLFKGLFSDVTVFAKKVIESLAEDLKQLQEGNSGISYACASFEQALNFEIVPEIKVDRTTPALVGEDISISRATSTITSQRYDKDQALTPTTDLEINIAAFTADSSNSDFMGEAEAKSGDLKAYWSNKLSGFDESNYKLLASSVMQPSLDKGDGNIKVLTFNDSRIPSDLTYHVGDLEVGTLVCFSMSIKYANSEVYNLSRKGDLGDRGVWVISNATCRSVAKKPSLQVWGGSTYSAGDIMTSTTTKETSAFGGVSTFGSWTEYGAIANGLISGFSSGNSLNVHPNNGSFAKDGNSPLTITNEDSRVLGSAQIDVNPKLLDRIVEIYRDPANNRPADSTTSATIGSCSEPICYKHYSNNVEISGSNIAGTTIIYGEKNITISGDLTYSTSAVSDINDIPQVVIIADGDIKINKGVSQVDAWLVATTGKLDTCADESSEFGTKNFGASTCDDTLTINGPIITKNDSDSNINYRTGGSGSKDKSADPAEIFNLPASTYLWSYNQGIKNGNGFYEVYQQELAPRL